MGDDLFFALKPARGDGLADERFLVGGETHFHEGKPRSAVGQCQARARGRIPALITSRGFILGGVSAVRQSGLLFSSERVRICESPGRSAMRCLFALLCAVVLLCAESPAQTCTGLCLQQVSCTGGGTTSISGTVYAPNGTDPLPNVLVYVPNAPVQPFPPGVSCDNCQSSLVTGSPLVTATTGSDGTFTISNMPVGTNIPLVIQNGRWRRQVVIPSVTACANTA